MKTENQVQKPWGTRELLENIAPNLYRHRENGSYYGIKKIAGKIKSHALHTADRKTADGKLRTWLGGGVIESGSERSERLSSADFQSAVSRASPSTGSGP